MKSRLLLVGLLLLSLSTASYADLVPFSRYDLISISSVNPDDFSGAIGSSYINQTWNGTAGSTYHATFTSSWASAGAWSWTGSANMNVANAQYNISLGEFSADIELISETSGTTSLHTNSSGVVLPLGQVDGYYAIEGLWSGWGGAYGGRFTFEAVLPGDWSGTGPGYMHHDLLNINSLWTIEKNFTYHSVTDTTTFLAYVDQYWVTNHLMDANLEVRLYGAAVPGPAPVPEPSTILLFGTGLAGLAAIGRKKRD